MNNPLPIPGTVLLSQTEVTNDMTSWSVEILKNQAWPMFATSEARAFGDVSIIARVEWHPPEPSIDHWHRGVTLYKVTGILLPEGVDVSSFQPKVDWSLVKQTKSFVFIKASEGLHLKDTLFQRHYAGAEGIPRGAYHYFHPELDPVAQAKLFMDAISGLTLELPPVLDAEAMNATTPPAVFRGILTWLACVKTNLGRLPIVYTMPSFWNALHATDELENDLWVAHWDVLNPIVPAPWKRWTFWQYSAKAGVAGIGDNMDVNRFGGSADDFALYVNGLERVTGPVVNGAANA